MPLNTATPTRAPAPNQSQFQSAPSMRREVGELLSRGSRRWVVLGLLALAAAVRLPGVFWGANFPIDIVALHNTDEGTHLNLARHLVTPASARTSLPKYPPATAVPVVLTIAAYRAMQGLPATPLPEKHRVIMLGRAFAVVAGSLTVVAVMLLALHLAAPWPAAVASGIAVALAPLHVTQSHFFLADAPSILWTTLGLWSLGVHLKAGHPRPLVPFGIAAFCFGAAFGYKLAPFGIPSLAVATLLPGARARRMAVGLASAAAGVMIVSAFQFGPRELLFVLRYGSHTPGVIIDRVQSALMYAIHLPGVFGTPVLVLAAVGGALLLRDGRNLRGSDGELARRWLLLWLPLATTLVMVFWRLDPFPRHLLTFLPWVAVFAGLGFERARQWLRTRRVADWILPVAAVAWLAAIVADEQRHFVEDPRNEAGRWMLANVAPGTDIFWINAPLRRYRNRQIFTKLAQTGERPAYIVMNMSYANSFLSGQGWRNSMPQNCRTIVIGATPERVRYMQDLMTGRGGYTEVARFPERYVMPELTVPLQLFGDRWRNFVSEAVILRRDDAWRPAPVATRPVVAGDSLCGPGL
jgi:hypothetical protein